MAHGRARAAGCLAALAGVLLAPPAVARDVPRQPTLDVQRFDPIAQKPGFTLVREAEIQAPSTFTAALGVSYALHPFELGDAETLERSVGVVDHLVGFDLGFGFTPTKWLHVGFDLPVLQVVGNAPLSRAVAQELGSRGQGAGIGDMRLSVALHPLRQGANAPISLAVVPFLGLPTGSRAQLVGSGAVQAGADLAVGGRWRHFRFSAHAGYAFLSDTEPVGRVLADDEVRWGVGLGVPFGRDDRFEASVEWVGGGVVLPGPLERVGARPFDARHTPSELLAGFAVLPVGQPWWVKAMVGPGLTKGFGTPDVRAFLQVGGVLRGAPPAPPEPPAPADTDGDGIIDPLDACPLEPEDHDGFEDHDGCPDPDNDLDGIPDVDDACPDEPEVVNGVDDLDGCPDEALAQVDVELEEIVIQDRIYFEIDLAALRPESQPVITAVANVLRAYKDVALVEVQGHTDERAEDDYNLDLSQRRADAVVAALVEEGIDPDRLVARGYGEARPVVPGAVTEEEHARNRRVQFVILRR